MTYAEMNREAQMLHEACPSLSPYECRTLVLQMEQNQHLRELNETLICVGTSVERVAAAIENLLEPEVPEFPEDRGLDKDC